LFFVFVLFFLDRHEMNAHIDNVEFGFFKYILNVLVHIEVNIVLNIVESILLLTFENG
jgi:hypothetical protein